MHLFLIILWHNIIGIFAAFVLTGPVVRWNLLSRRSFYLLCGALFIVLQFDFLTARRPSPIAYWSLMFSTIVSYMILGIVFYDLYRRKEDKIRAFINRLKRE